MLKIENFFTKIDISTKYPYTTIQSERNFLGKEIQGYRNFLDKEIQEIGIS